MRPSPRITVIVSVLLVSCLLSSILLLHRIDLLRSRAPLQDVLYVSSPRVLKRLSLGYEGLLADIYWTRAVQYFGGKHYIHSAHYDLLAPLLEITTVLDPHLTVAYEFGANFLAPKPPYGAGLPERAIALNEYGIRYNPGDWHLYNDLGFIYYTELKDYVHAADAFARGSEVPHAHPFLRIMAARMAEHGGEIEMARMMWTTAYQSTKDRSIQANALAHLRALRVDEDVTLLEKLVSRYKASTGHLPSSFYDLQSAGFLRAMPVDPLGHTYKLMADGSVEVRAPDDLPFIEKGTPPGYIAPPPRFLPSDLDGSAEN